MKNIVLTLWTLVLAVCSARSALVLDEPFNYPDGTLLAVAGNVWTNHSGTLNQVDVVSGKIVLSQNQTEDLSAPLPGGPYGGPALYASFTVNFSTLPAGEGTYFVHFKDATATGFRCRVFATTNGAPAGKFRLAIANGAGAPVSIPTDLESGTDYPVVMRYQSAAPRATLWIRPDSESTSVDRADATDSASTLSILSFALRQAGPNPGIGVLTFDDLKVGTTFSDVAASGYSLQIQGDVAGVEVSWPAAAEGYKLQWCDSLRPPNWADAPETPARVGEKFVVHYLASEAARLFRLIKP
jgi:hypothetical protein